MADVHLIDAEKGEVGKSGVADIRYEQLNLQI